MHLGKGGTDSSTTNLPWEFTLADHLLPEEFSKLISVRDMKGESALKTWERKEQPTPGSEGGSSEATGLHKAPFC